MKLVGLGQSAQTLLTQFVTELTALGVDVPEQQYVAAGVVPWDCPALVISLGSITQGLPGQPTSHSYVSTGEIITTAVLHIELIREVSTFGYGSGIVGIPSADAMDTEGVSALDDAGALYQAAINIKNKGKAVPLGVDFAIGTAQPIGPDGGMAAVSLSLDISLDGS